jgi:hypothetical protein
MKSFRFLSFGFVYFLFLVLLAGCKAGRPARVTLPDQLSNRDISGNDPEKVNPGNNEDVYTFPGLPFYAVDTTINSKLFTAIYLRNAAFDSLAFGIIKSYEPFANSLLKIIAEQGIKGVLIDFRRNDGSDASEAKFSVDYKDGERSENFKTEPLNIVFLWDEVSASRASGFINELNTSSIVSVKTISNSRSTSPGYRQDCFRPAYTNFDEQ